MPRSRDYLSISLSSDRDQIDDRRYVWRDRLRFFTQRTRISVWCPKHWSPNFAKASAEHVSRLLPLCGQIKESAPLVILKPFQNKEKKSNTTTTSKEIVMRCHSDEFIQGWSSLYALRWVDTQILLLYAVSHGSHWPKMTLLYLSFFLSFLEGQIRQA